MAVTRSSPAKKTNNSTVVRRRGARETDAPAKEDERKVPVAEPPVEYTLWLRFRYWVGFLMGLAACIGSIVTFDKNDSHKEYKFTGWLLFSLIGLYFHETRPFKKF
jgi:hypothetical protein